MKILQVIPTLDASAGGPVEGLLQQGVVMTEMGHDVQTVCLDGPELQVDHRLRSSAVYKLGPRYLGYSFAPRLEPWLREYATRYDVIIVHGMWTYHGYAVAKVARDVGVPYVVFLHGMLDPWFAKNFPLKHLKKWLYWPWAEYRTLRDAALVLFTTHEELLLARQSFWLYKARERLVGYGIRDRSIPKSTARAAFLERFPSLAQTKNILYLSRLHPKKGCDLLIRAFAKIAQAFPDRHLIMGGPGDQKYIDDLHELVEKHGLQGRVTFTGMLKGELKWGAYDASEVFALPSHQENFGIVLAEALCSGLPTLTTRQVNIWREIQESGAGIIDVDTQEGTDRLLSQWLSTTEHQKDEMRKLARNCFEKHFQVESVTAKLVNALTDAATRQCNPHTFAGSLFARRNPA